MTKTLDFIRSRNSVSSLHVHLVFVSKYRKKVFSAKALKAMNQIFSRVCLEQSCHLLEFDGERDHVYALVRYPPKTANGQLVHALKGRSSRLIRERFPEIQRHYWRGVLWSPSYFAASCGGVPIEVIRKYIENQATPA